MVSFPPAMVMAPSGDFDGLLRPAPVDTSSWANPWWNVFAGIAFNMTFVNNFRMIGQGPGNNFDVHENEHITVTPDGTVSVFHDNFSVTC